MTRMRTEAPARPLHNDDNRGPRVPCGEDPDLEQEAADGGGPHRAGCGPRSTLCKLVWHLLHVQPCRFLALSRQSRPCCHPALRSSYSLSPTACWVSRPLAGRCVIIVSTFHITITSLSIHSSRSTLSHLLSHSHSTRHYSLSLLHRPDLRWSPGRAEQHGLPLHAELL